MKKKATSRRKPDYKKSVFINCPFDDEFREIFEAIVFAVEDCGFRARCSREADNSGGVRLENIVEIIRGSRLGVHDLTRMELDEKNRLPRFNMPLELGLFFGAQHFGDAAQGRKMWKIVDGGAPYRYQIALSDIAGIDIDNHSNDPKVVIRIIRNWLSDVSIRDDPGERATVIIPGPSRMIERHEGFRAHLTTTCQELGHEETNLTFLDYRDIVRVWLEDNPIG